MNRNKLLNARPVISIFIIWNVNGVIIIVGRFGSQTDTHGQTHRTHTPHGSYGERMHCPTYKYKYNISLYACSVSSTCVHCFGNDMSSYSSQTHERNEWIAYTNNDTKIVLGKKYYTQTCTVHTAVQMGCILWLSLCASRTGMVRRNALLSNLYSMACYHIIIFTHHLAFAFNCTPINNSAYTRTHMTVAQTPKRCIYRHRKVRCEANKRMAQMTSDDDNKRIIRYINIISLIINVTIKNGGKKGKKRILSAERTSRAKIKTKNAPNDGSDNAVWVCVCVRTA